MKIELVAYTEEFFELSLKWLDDPEIRRLTNTPSFPKSVQKKWFDSLGTNPNYKIWGIDYDQIHVGVCGLKNISTTDCEYWGYIGEKTFWGQGVGSFVLNTLLDYAKSQEKSFVWLIVLNENIRAINLYSKMGFKNVSILENNLLKMQFEL